MTSLPIGAPLIKIIRLQYHLEYYQALYSTHIMHKPLKLLFNLFSPQHYWYQLLNNVTRLKWHITNQYTIQTTYCFYNSFTTSNTILQRMNTSRIGNRNWARWLSRWPDKWIARVFAGAAKTMWVWLKSKLRQFLEIFSSKKDGETNQWCWLSKYACVLVVLRMTSDKYLDSGQQTDFRLHLNFSSCHLSPKGFKNCSKHP